MTKENWYCQLKPIAITFECTTLSSRVSATTMLMTIYVVVDRNPPPVGQSILYCHLLLHPLFPCSSSLLVNLSEYCLSAVWWVRSVDFGISGRMNGRAKPSHEHSRVLSRSLLVMSVAQIYYVKSRVRWKFIPGFKTLKKINIPYVQCRCPLMNYNVLISLTRYWIYLNGIHILWKTTSSTVGRPHSIMVGSSGLSGSRNKTP